MDESISQIMKKSVEVVKTVLQERTPERIREQGGIIEVSKISSQDRMLQRTVKQILNESVVPERVQWQIVESLVPRITEDSVEELKHAPQKQLVASFVMMMSSSQCLLLSCQRCCMTPPFWV